ncbi:Glycosyltransferase involved in cell wall bisynthesis [Salinihabitans flavidus]|uniref:Glycosyltransferase involved in cell wall bisynthesis n=1 Tax=Salinihabitans flavidus TaxID=569882 RepID=A0A1H8NZG0_9RHOB|nr:glycosyltransferase [Salinihabitans flavidus]SEO34992.1 Glycosyltransferase involved in cell wall bisynthesis [Salinihabitans flavidus]
MTGQEKPAIAYLTGEYPRATDTFIQREVAVLRALGHVVHTCSIRRTGAEHLVGDEQRQEAGGTFYVLAAARAPLHLLACHVGALGRAPGLYLRALRLAWHTRQAGLRGMLYQLFYFAEAGVLAAHLRRKRVRLLHNHIAKSSCTVAMLASEMSGVPYSFTLHGPDIFFAPEHWRLDAKIARARFVACISHFARSQAMVFSDQAHWRKLHIVHCGVEPERYAGQAGGAGRNLVFVGRLAAVKGIAVLLEALATLRESHPDLHLTLIGDGPERVALEGRARQLGVKGCVTFAGYRSQDEVAGTLRGSDLLVLPSFAEGVPVVLMEAMAAGLPVVATQVAGVSELVEDGVSGRLVPPGDAGALADAIDTILRDPEEAVRLGQAGRAKVQAEFTVKAEAAWLSRLMTGYLEGEAPDTLRPEGKP